MSIPTQPNPNEQQPIHSTPNDAFLQTHALIASDTHTPASSVFTKYPIVSPPATLGPSASRRLLLINLTLVARNLVFQTLDIVLELSDLLLHLRLQAVRGAFSWRGDLMFDGERKAALGLEVGMVMAVAFRVGTSTPEPGLGAGGVENGGLGVAAAFEGEDVVVTHG